MDSRNLDFGMQTNTRRLSLKLRPAEFELTEWRAARNEVLV
jgi:hypothetical protein